MALRDESVIVNMVVNKVNVQAFPPVNAGTSRFIEQLGVLLETDGYSPVAGRLFGLLLLTEDTCSLDELARELAVSKASVSINVRLLAQRGVVERVGQPGDRRDHYRIAPDLLARTMEQRLARWRRFHEAIASARGTPAIRSRTVRARLDELEQAYAHMLGVTTRALEEWRSRPGRPRPQGART